MKKILVVLGVASVAVVAAVAYLGFYQPQTTVLKNGEGLDHIYEMFDNFMIKHRKNYFNKEEFHFRRELYVQRLIENFEHNRQPGVTWFKDINRFSDLTEDEFKRYYLGYRKSDVDFEVEELEFDENAELESSVDWKKKGAVAAVKDQGNCGSCWAFSTIAGLEGAYHLKSKSENSIQTFSEQQLVDCATKSYGNYGCDGGDLPGSYKYLESYAAESESSYPYHARDHKCQYNKSKGITKVSGAKKIKKGSDSALKQGLASKPLAVCIDASTLQSYSSGVIDVNACGKRPELDHCVLLYGYNSAWLLKNSWGKSWGESGYFRFAMGGNTCGIQEEAMSASV